MAMPFLRRNKRLADGFAWRLVPQEWCREPVDLWIQAASGGEAWLTWEILKKLDSPLSVLATTWTRQGLEVLQGMAAKLQQERPEMRVRVTLFPLDSPKLMARALDQAKPKAVVLLETELWPGLLLSAADRTIPVVVLNGRMTEKSLNHYAMVEKFCPHFWQSVAPRSIRSISLADAARFATLFGKDRVACLPNIKFDRCVPQSCSDLDVKHLLPQGHPCILLASTREEEEDQIFHIIQLLHKSSDSPTIILAPRHLHRIESWKKRLDTQHDTLHFVVRSHLTEHGAQSGDIILWDRFGELSALYEAADAVLIGGSLAPLGGQNFLEALAQGKIPCCGPHLENFAWVEEIPPNADPADTLANKGLIFQCHSPEEAAKILVHQMKNPQSPAEVCERFQSWLAPRLGGAEASAKVVRQFL